MERCRYPAHIIFYNAMNILSISTDRKIFEKGSAVRARMVSYGQLFSELHIIIFTQAKANFQPEKIAENVWVYPTRSRSRVFYIIDALTLAKKILGKRNTDLRKVHSDQVAVGDEKWVLTCQDPFETGLVGVRLAKKFRIPLQIQIHTDFLSPYFISHSLLNRLRVWISFYTLPRAHGIRVVSQRIKDSILARHITIKREPDILPIYVDREQIISAPVQYNIKTIYPHFDYHILMASRLTPEKNISYALEVFSKLIKEIPNACLIIVGSGSEELALKNRVRQLALSDNVVFVPWTNDVVSYYKSADLFLNTSIYEGYGLTLVEAALSHCPIVSTDIGIIGFELSTLACAVCKDQDPISAATKIVNLLNNKTLVRDMAERAFSEIENRAMTKADYFTRYKTLFTKIT